MFRVGDKVRCVEPSQPPNGMIGTVARLPSSPGDGIGVYFSDLDAQDRGHNLRGMLDTSGGWWFCLPGWLQRVSCAPAEWPPKASRKAKYKDMENVYV